MNPRSTTPKIRRSPRERGAALIVVIAMLLVLTLIGMGSINTATQQITLSSHQTYSFQAGQLAKAAIHRIADEFRRQDVNLLWHLLCKKAYNPSSKPVAQLEQCDRAQSLCFNSSTLFPKAASNPLDHGAMRWNSFTGIRDSTTNLPKLWGDFKLLVTNPRLATHGRPIAGNDVKRTCTYVVTVTSSGRIEDPNQNVGPNVRHKYKRDLSTRSYRAYIQVIGRGDTCNGCPS